MANLRDRHFFEILLLKLNIQLRSLGLTTPAEHPHWTLANIVCAGLENAGLSAKFWSDALLHAVFLKNYMSHAAFSHKITPYERLTGTPPDLRKLRIFGSRVVCRKPGKHTPKLSKHSYSGIFLQYAKTLKNIVYLDVISN